LNSYVDELKKQIQDARDKALNNLSNDKLDTSDTNKTNTKEINLDSEDIKNTDFFNAAYLAILNKERGPRLVNLILVVGKDKIIKLLKQIK